MSHVTNSFLALGLLALGTFALPASGGDLSATGAVWEHHIAAWSARDVPAILEDYDDDSTVVLMHRVYRGKAEIGRLFRNLFGLFDGATDHVIDPATLQGNIVYITWRAKLAGVSHPVGTDTFVIEKGKITYQTITADSAFFKTILSKP